MGKHCAAVGCFNNDSKPECKGKSFFRFPIKDPELLKIWDHKINRIDFVPNEFSRICMDHFEDDCFGYQPFTNRRHLKKGAIPTKFNFEKSFGRELKRMREEPPDYQIKVAATDVIDEKAASSNTRKIFVGDYKLSDMSSPTQAAEFYELATAAIEEKNKALKVLRQKTQRLETKVNELNSLLKFYQEKAVYSENYIRLIKSLNKQPETVFGSGLDFQVASVTPTNMVVDDSSTLISPDIDPPYSPAAGPSSQDTTSSNMMEQKVHLAMTCDIYPTNVNPTDSLSANVKQEPQVSSSDRSLFEPAVLIKEELVSSEEE